MMDIRILDLTADEIDLARRAMEGRRIANWPDEYRSEWNEIVERFCADLEREVFGDE